MIFLRTKIFFAKPQPFSLGGKKSQLLIESDVEHAFIFKTSSGSVDFDSK